jgi:hypothetical protein
MKIEKAKQTLKNRKQVDPSKEYPTQDPLDEDKLFNFFMTTMPVSVRPKEGSTFAMKNFWELSGKPLTFNNAIQSGMY